MVLVGFLQLVNRTTEGCWGPFLPSDLKVISIKPCSNGKMSINGNDGMVHPQLTSVFLICKGA